MLLLYFVFTAVMIVWPWLGGTVYVLVGNMLSGAVKEEPSRCWDEETRGSTREEREREERFWFVGTVRGTGKLACRPLASLTRFDRRMHRFVPAIVDNDAYFQVTLYLFRAQQ